MDVFGFVYDVFQTLKEQKQGQEFLEIFCKVLLSFSSLGSEKIEFYLSTFQRLLENDDIIASHHEFC